ncbi:hypothetical protein [Nocardia sp. NPDC051570]|uniref:hypothetical protein n=1 Tax=Nocardia sp. NPDC051570 TaxID=3364324 RepID=UPI0037A74C2D
MTDPNVDTTDITDESDLIWAGPGFVTIMTGIAYGPVNLTVELLDHAPDDTDLDEWEVVEETIVDAAADLQILPLMGSEPESSDRFEPIPAGRYRVRAHARGRDIDRGLDVTEAGESNEYHLIRLWLDADAGPEVRQLRKTDDIPVEEPSEYPQPNRDYVYVFDAHGDIQRVPPNSPEVEAVYARKDSWNGRTPSAALGEIINAREVAFLDRDLVDHIEALPQDRQREFARWCAHRAFEKSRLIDIDWLRDALTALDQGTLPPDFENSSLARYRLDNDPRIRPTVVSGLPGSIELIQQHQALSTYFNAIWFEPLRSAIEAFWRAAATYGMDYPELVAAAKRDFFPSQS